MQSKYKDLKENALRLRSSGLSIKAIEIKLKVPRSTLSGWFKDILLTDFQRKILKYNSKEALKRAREAAVAWHQNQKNNRIIIAKDKADKVISRLDLNNTEIITLSLAMLYLGEGFKKNGAMGLGNTDPLILKFFVKAVMSLYSIKPTEFRCELHLRADQNPKELKVFWSKELGIPQENFKNISFDERTIGRKTYEYYKGVCLVRLGNIAIQRKLVYLGRIFCEKIVYNMGG